MKITLFAVLLASGFLSACVPYPVYKTLQPAAKATVLDQASKPIAQAEVTLVSMAYPYARENSRAVQKTGNDGTARFNAVREWRIESLMLHGSEEFFWNWCIRKNGYVTHFTSHNSAKDFDNSLVIRLKPGESKPCPQGLQRR
jgi:hypothetical protein